MTVKQIFSLIGGGICSLSLCNPESREIRKNQKAKVKEAEQEAQQATQAAEQAAQQTEQVIVAVQQANATEEALDTQQATNEQVYRRLKVKKRYWILLLLLSTISITSCKTVPTTVRLL